MTERMQYQAPSIFTNTSPQVQVDDGTAKYLDTKANVFLNNANEAHKRQLRSDLDLAKKEGERIGYDLGKNFQPSKNSSLFARQFNKSGLQMAGEKISMETQRKVRGLSKQYPANPGGLDKALTGWKEGFIEELPDELQPVFGLNFDKISEAAVEKAASERKALDAQASAARFFEFEREVQNTVEELAPLSFRQGVEGQKAREALATIRQNYMESLAGNGPEGEYNVGGYRIKSAPGRSGAFTPLEIQKKLTAFDNGIIEAGVYGNFQEEVDAGRGVEAYMQFAKGDMEISAVNDKGEIESVKISDVLTSDEMDGLAGRMRTFIGGINSIEEGEYRKFERGRERYNDDFLRRAYGQALQVEKDPNTGESRVVGGDPVVLQNMISSAIQDPMIEVGTIDQLQKLANELGSGQIDNPVTVGTTWQGISTGEIADYRSVPTQGISDTQRIKMYEAIDSRNKGQHWTNSTRYRVASDYADAVLAPEKSAGFTMFGDPSKESAADRAEWNRRMIEEALAAEQAGLLPSNPNALPGKTPDGRQEFDFVARGKEIADEIAAKRKAPENPEMTELENQIKEIEAQMNNPKEGDDTEAIKQRYRELQDRKNTLKTRQMMGLQ